MPQSYRHDGRLGFIRPGCNYDDLAKRFYLESQLAVELRDPDNPDEGAVLVARPGARPIDVMTAVSFEGDHDYDDLRLRASVRTIRDRQRRLSLAEDRSPGRIPPTTSEAPESYRGTDLVVERADGSVEYSDIFRNAVSLYQKSAEDSRSWVLNYLVAQNGIRRTESLELTDIQITGVPSNFSYYRDEKRTRLFVNDVYVEGPAGSEYASWDMATLEKVSDGQDGYYLLASHMTRSDPERSVTLAVSKDLHSISEWYFDVKQSMFRAVMWVQRVWLSETSDGYVLHYGSRVVASGLESISAAVSAAYKIDEEL